MVVPTWPLTGKLHHLPLPFPRIPTASREPRFVTSDIASGHALSPDNTPNELLPAACPASPAQLTLLWQVAHHAGPAMEHSQLVGFPATLACSLLRAVDPLSRHLPLQFRHFSFIQCGPYLLPSVEGLHEPRVSTIFQGPCQGVKSSTRESLPY